MATTILDVLEFTQIRKMLAEHCQFSLSIERAQDLGPTNRHDIVHYLLNVTSEAIELLESRPEFSVGGVKDIRDRVDRASIGATLSPSDLLEVLDTVAAARTLRRSFFRIEDRAERFPHISEFVGFVADLPGLEADLRRAISAHGEILDTASDELASIRRRLRTAQSRAAERIRRYTQSADYTDALQEPIVTSRGGRFVVPVRADRRSQLPGMVHDTSASGQTLFVEPAEMVELNNQVRELESAEQHEVERILRWLTSQVAAKEDELLTSLDGMAAIDLALAKARLASRLAATRPVISDSTDSERRRIALNRARHPLLPRDEVVPLDILLGRDFRVLVITGPNTGGKTVALKTVGLLTLMAQAGLFIPADEGSELPVFDAIYADIGDEQSIEQSLSTFSSHIVRVIAALEGLSEQSLVLFDELGAGTDPEEGSALARAIISRLVESGCLAIATTHYSELKTYAYSTEQVENASVEFDVETLSPTFRLEIGVPGRSNALAIASRLGMPDEIVERSRSYIDPESEQADVLITEIRTRRREAEEALAAAERSRQDAQDKLQEAEERRSRAELEALSEIERELADARDYIRNIRKLPEQVAPQEFNETRSSAQEQLNRAGKEVRRAARERAPRQEAAPKLQVGDTVELMALGGEGEIVGFSEDGYDAEVQMGSFKIWQPTRDLKKIKAAATQQRRNRVRTPAPSRSVDPELHLRGQRAGSIEMVVDSYLDDAYLSHMPFVRIVHGKGTGALREAVREVLGRHPLVKRYETPPANEGGDGVTIVYLKES
ncbi:endonuclease MutS2 [soil metagenome]